jgi:hypothetical protein
MATALRNATKLFGHGHDHIAVDPHYHHAQVDPGGASVAPLPDTGGTSALPFVATGVLAAGLAAKRLAHHDDDNAS